MDPTERAIEALTVCLANALHDRRRTPADFKLISAVRSAIEELRRLKALVPTT